MEDILETFELDVKKGVLKVNGLEKSRVTSFELTFDGSYHLSVTENFKSDSSVYAVKTGKKKNRPTETDG